MIEAPTMKRLEAKSRLTHLQYIGWCGLLPKDHVKINEVLRLILGDYSFEVPCVCTDQWGFQDWAKYITGEDWQWA